MSKRLAEKEGDEFSYKGKDYIVTKMTEEQQYQGRKCSKLCDVGGSCIEPSYFYCHRDLVIKLNEEEVW